MRNRIPILICMHSEADATVISSLLKGAGLEFFLCPVASLSQDSVERWGALLLEEEVLTAPVLDDLQTKLRKQPSWSALPVVLLAKNLGRRREQGHLWLQNLPGLTLIERPIASPSLVSVLQAVLESRRGQFEVRDLLAVRQRAKEDLEERVRKRTAELKRSNSELEQFAYAVAHDLREPLRTITGLLQLIKRRYQGRLDARADTFIIHTVEESERLDAMIRDLLAYSRYQRQEIKFQPVDLSQVVARVRNELRSLLEASRGFSVY